MTQADGLILLPSRYDPPLGYGGFEARFSDEPAARYFDACRAYFPVEVFGVLKRQVVEHPWSGGELLRFSAGRIRLEAHRGDFAEIYTFGGEAALTDEGRQTVCRANSNAPFLLLNDDPESPMTVLESEFEVILAQSRARWGKDEYVHLDRLGSVDPLTLFRAALQAVEQRLTPLLRADGDEALRDTVHLVRQMRGQLTRAGDWPVNAPELDDIL